MTATELSIEEEEMWSTFFDDNHTDLVIVAEMFLRCHLSPERILRKALSSLENSLREVSLARFHRTLLTGPEVQVRQKNIAIDTVDFLIFNPRPSWTYHPDKALKEATLDLLARENTTGCAANFTVASADELANVKQILAKIP